MNEYFIFKEVLVLKTQIASIELNWIEYLFSTGITKSKITVFLYSVSFIFLII